MKRQRRARAQAAFKEHKKLSKEFYLSVDEDGTPMQHVFDVGRLGSPMWQKYRDLFKDKIKKGLRERMVMKSRPKPHGSPNGYIPKPSK
jgi:hypothetical protein